MKIINNNLYQFIELETQSDTRPGDIVLGVKPANIYQVFRPYTTTDRVSQMEDRLNIEVDYDD